MRKDNSERKGHKFSLYIFECVMSVFYLALAYVLFFTKYFNESINGNLRLVLGLLLGVYGVFRIYRAIRKYLDNRQKE